MNFILIIIGFITKLKYASTDRQYQQRLFLLFNKAFYPQALVLKQSTYFTCSGISHIKPDYLRRWACYVIGTAQAYISNMNTVRILLNKDVGQPMTKILIKKSFIPQNSPIDVHGLQRKPNTPEYPLV